MISVFASPSLLASANPVQILVGQIICREQNGKHLAKSEYLLFQSIPCEDVEVLAEQIDCIDEVLSTSLQVLGVYADTSNRRKVETLLKDHHSYGELLFVEKKEGNFVAYHMGSKQSSTITLDNVVFSQFDCSMFSHVYPLPILLTTADAKETVVALGERVALCDLGVGEQILSGRQLGAPPANSRRCAIPLVLSLKHTRGCDMFKYMQRYVEKTQRRGTACVQVQSKTYDGLVFCCFCKDFSVPLNEELWQSISEMIGDAVGEAVTRAQLIGAAASSTPVQRSSKMTHPSLGLATEAKHSSKGDANNMVLYLGAAVVAFAVVLVWLCS